MKIILVGALVLAPTVRVFAQNTLQFTSVNATPEKAIQLHWASNTNEVYEIDYATSLIDTNTGTITWNQLYSDYPSQGTNTFWLDAGNFQASPSVPHPKNDSLRFYRVVLTGTNSGPNPTISILNPTDGATASSNLTVTVSAASSVVLANIKLYVDGQEQNPSQDGSNFVINTTEWWNGQHTLFATAKSMTHYEGLPGDNAITYGHAVSSYVNVTFNNLISEVQYSQQYFEPSLGQTQEVTATFAANADWTLQIQDQNGNAVRHASGSGNWLDYLWDGTGDGETNMPDGSYMFLISAVTNGLADEVVTGGGGSGGGGSPPSPDDEASRLYIVDTDTETVTPPAIYPPSFDTNGLTIIPATTSEVRSLTATTTRSGRYSISRIGGGVTPDSLTQALHRANPP